MILYISGFNSTKKNYIDSQLKASFGESYIYYVLTNKFSDDLTNLSNIIKDQYEVVIISHSTGGFLSLCLYRMHDNIIALHCINPAFDLLYSLDKEPLAHEYLKERSLIADQFDLNKQYYVMQPFPIGLYQGTDDNRVNINYNYDFIPGVVGITHKYKMEHRFTEEQFTKILNEIKSCLFEPY